MRVKVLRPIEMQSLEHPTPAELGHAVRNAIGDQLVEWRATGEADVFGSKGRPVDKGRIRGAAPGADATASA